MIKKTPKVLMCKLYNCDHRHGNYCCFNCQNICNCKNPCLNSPLKCGYAREVIKNEKEIESDA